MSYMAVSGATLSKIGTVLGTASGVIAASQGQPVFGQPGYPGYQEPGMPDWVMPVVLIGGIGLVAFLVMKKGPTKNPGSYWKYRKLTRTQKKRAKEMGLSQRDYAQFKGA